MFGMVCHAAEEIVGVKNNHNHPHNNKNLKKF